MMQSKGSPAQYVAIGNGTAQRKMLDILGIEDNKKEVVFSLIKEELIPDMKKDLEAFFISNKRNKGIGYSLDLTGIIGVKFYRFIADVL